MISSENPGIVELFAQANTPFNRLLINKHNFTVVSIAPTSDPKLNTIAEIRVDRTINTRGGTVALPPGEERYFNRSVQLHRFDIAEVLKLQLGLDGKVAIPGWDNNVTDSSDLVDQLIEGFTEAHFTHDDIYIVPTSTVGNYVVVAKPNSFGYVGRAQIDVSAEEPAP